MRLQEVQQHMKGSIELAGSEPAEKPATWHSSAEQTGSGSGEGKQGIEPGNWPSQEKVAGTAQAMAQKLQVRRERTSQRASISKIKRPRNKVV